MFLIKKMLAEVITGGIVASFFGTKTSATRMERLSEYEIWLMSKVTLINETRNEVISQRAGDARVIAIKNKFNCATFVQWYPNTNTTLATIPSQR